MDDIVEVAKVHTDPEKQFSPLIPLKEEIFD